MGEWANNKYLGSALPCPQCKRTYVSQLWKGCYAEVQCTCNWCSHTWKINSICKDESNEEATPPAYWKYSTSGD